MTEKEEKIEREKIMKYIYKTIALTIVFCIAFVFFGFHYIPIEVPQGDLDLAAKLTFTLRWQTLNVLSLIIGIILVMKGREGSPAMNPLDRREDKRMQVNMQYLQNSLEQFAIATFVQLILATWLESRHLKVIPLLCMLFLIGRIGFLVGYHKGPQHRGFGFSATWGPTFISFLYCLFCLCFRGGQSLISSTS